MTTFALISLSFSSPDQCEAYLGDKIFPVLKRRKFSDMEIVICAKSQGQQVKESDFSPGPLAS